LWNLSSVLSQKSISKKSCHPERSLTRFLRQTESKDLLFGISIYAMNFRDTALAQRVHIIFDAIRPSPRMILEANPHIDLRVIMLAGLNYLRAVVVECFSRFL